LEALFFYIKAVPRSDPVPSEPMTSPQKRFCDFPLVELTGTSGYYSMLAGKGQAKRPGKGARLAGKGARLEFSRFEPGPFNPFFNHLIPSLAPLIPLILAFILELHG